MVSSESPHTRDIPTTDEAPRTRKGGPATTIMFIARCFVWPWVILFLCMTLTSFASAVERPDLATFKIAFIMLMLCVAGIWGMHRFLTQPRYANSAIALILSLLLFYVVYAALPNFVTHREKSPLEAAVGSIESIRAAIRAYTAEAPGNSYPARMADWGELTSVVNANGATLKNTAAEQGFDLRGYTAIDSDGDGIFEDYTMSFLVDGVPDTDIGRLVLVGPSGIEKARP